MVVHKFTVLNMCVCSIVNAKPLSRHQVRTVSKSLPTISSAVTRDVVGLYTDTKGCSFGSRTVNTETEDVQDVLVEEGNPSANHTEYKECMYTEDLTSNQGMIDHADRNSFTSHMSVDSCTLSSHSPKRTSGSFNIESTRISSTEDVKVKSGMRSRIKSCTDGQQSGSECQLSRESVYELHAKKRYE